MTIPKSTLDVFLAAFFPDESEPVALRFFKAKDEPQGDHNAPRVEHTTRYELRMDTRLQARLRELNRTRGAYFVVNSGGDNDSSITRVNAFFVECDETSIAEQHAAFDGAPLTPSIRLETRKSVHAYFLLSGECSVAEWIDMQKRLIARFGGDAKNKNPSRVFRLPYFNHVHFDKEMRRYEYKRVEIKYFDASRRYTLNEMQAAFPIQTDTHSQSAHGKAGSGATGTRPSDGNQTFATFEELNAELKRRIMAQAKQNTRGIYEMRGLCHNGQGETALMFNPATGAIHCNSGCDFKAILRAFGLPETANIANQENARRKAPSRFAFTALDDLLDEPEETTAYVWDKALPVGGFSICAAKPKVGKSTLARNLAVAVSQGAEFFGRATMQGKVIYLCLEEKRAEVAAHFRRMNASGRDILIHTGRTPDDALEALHAAVEELAPALVIIDPLSRFVRVGDFNSYGEVTRGLEPLIDLARSSGCHIQAVHHNGKGERDGGDALLGSTALFGSVDALLLMKRRERARTLESVQRYGTDFPETVVHLDMETGLVTQGGDIAALQVDEHKTKVLEVLGDEPLTESEIREQAGGNQSLISKALRALFEAGEVERSGAGKRGDAYRYTKKVGFSVSRFSNIEKPRNQENQQTESDVFDDDLSVEFNDEMTDEETELSAHLEYYGASREEADRTARRTFQDVPF